MQQAQIPMIPAPEPPDFKRWEALVEREITVLEQAIGTPRPPGVVRCLARTLDEHHPLEVDDDTLARVILLMSVAYSQGQAIEAQRQAPKYAVVAVLDQTIGFVTEEGSYTTKHPEAKLWDDIQDASYAASKASSRDAIGRVRRGDEDDEAIAAAAHVVELVIDEFEFRAREDTW